MGRATFWGLFGLTLAIHALMIFWSLPVIAAAASGLTALDLRPGGYSYAEAATFIAALTAEGADFYRGVQHRLDTIYPALVALTLYFSMLALAPRGLGRWRYLAGVIALPVALFDYLENSAVALMLEAEPLALTYAMVADASRCTVLKSGATTLATVIVLLGMVSKTWRPLLRRLSSRFSV